MRYIVELTVPRTQATLASSATTAETLAQPLLERSTASSPQPDPIIFLDLDALDVPQRPSRATCTTSNTVLEPLSVADRLARSGYSTASTLSARLTSNAPGASTAR